MTIEGGKEASLVERLEDPLTMSMFVHERLLVREALRQRAEAAARIRALEDALLPFAEACEAADDGVVDDGGHAWESAMAMAVTYGDFRRAAQALSSSQGGGNG